MSHRSSHCLVGHRNSHRNSAIVVVAVVVVLVDVQFSLAGSKACVAGHLLVQDPACMQKGGSQPVWQLHVPFPPSKTPWPLHVVASSTASFNLVAHEADASM